MEDRVVPFRAALLWENVLAVGAHFSSRIEENPRNPAVVPIAEARGHGPAVRVLCVCLAQVSLRPEFSELVPFDGGEVYKAWDLVENFCEVEVLEIARKKTKRNLSSKCDMFCHQNESDRGALGPKLEEESDRLAYDRR